MIASASTKSQAAAGKRTPRVSAEARQAVEAAVQGIAGYKGYPWSQTEYNCAYYPARQAIEQEHGPGAAALFDQLAAALPVRGGRFNPYSGD